MACRDAARDDRHLRLSLRDGDARLEPGKYAEPGTAADGGVRIRQGLGSRIPFTEPDACVHRKLKPRGNHADNRKLAATKRIDIQSLADYVGVAVKALLPKGVADDGAPQARAVVFLESKEAPELGRDTERPEEIGRRVDAVDAI